jgi:AraC-like DNA-binding protein
MFSYPLRLLPKLASEIEHSQREGSHRDLERLLQLTLEQSKYRLWKFRCAQIGSASMRGAVEGGASGKLLMKEHLQMLNQLSSLRGKNQIQKFMHRYLDQLLDHVAPAQRTNIESAVDQIRKKIRRSLEHPRSLAQYAVTLQVSPEHLSRSFSRIVGHSFRQELRQARTEAACRLLSKTLLKLSVIAQRIGLRDPSQFIADFHSQMGITPGKYRKVHCRFGR